ncbi:histone H1.5-like [Eucyclogobius newberryi]|uniref:histone H1.5-like n=1 Tax=Eucyclogobius newberryi TaxID=166745 RepID=UPI003B5B1133
MAKARAKTRVSRRKAVTGPILKRLIIETIAESNERKGLSPTAVKKALEAKGIKVGKTNKRITTALNKMLRSGTVSQTKGMGAYRSFKLKKRPTKAKKRAASRKRKVVRRTATKRRKSAARKRAAPKKRTKKRTKKHTKRAKRPKRAAPRKAKVVRMSGRKTSARRSGRKASARKSGRKASARKSGRKTSARSV